MQRLIFSALFACTIFSAGCGTAQTATAETKSAVENRLDRIDAEIKELGLSEAQAKSYREIDARYAKELKELRRNSGSNREVMAAEGGKLRATQEREVFDMLTDQQRDTYNTIKERAKTEMRNLHRGGGGRS